MFVNVDVQRYRATMSTCGLVLQICTMACFLVTFPSAIIFISRNGIPASFWDIFLFKISKETQDHAIILLTLLSFVLLFFSGPIFKGDCYFFHLLGILFHLLILCLYSFGIAVFILSTKKKAENLQNANAMFNFKNNFNQMTQKISKENNNRNDDTINAFGTFDIVVISAYIIDLVGLLIMTIKSASIGFCRTSDYIEIPNNDINEHHSNQGNNFNNYINTQDNGNNNQGNESQLFLQGYRRVYRNEQFTNNENHIDSESMMIVVNTNSQFETSPYSNVSAIPTNSSLHTNLI